MTVCRIREVSGTGFYAPGRKPFSDRAIGDGRLLGLIRASYAAGGAVYGSPRIFADLREPGKTCGKHRVAGIMRAYPPSNGFGRGSNGTP